MANTILATASNTAAFTFSCICGCCTEDVYRVLWATNGTELTEVTTVADCMYCSEVNLWLPDSYINWLNHQVYLPEEPYAARHGL